MQLVRIEGIKQRRLGLQRGGSNDRGAMLVIGGVIALSNVTRLPRSQETRLPRHVGMAKPLGGLSESAWDLLDS